MRRYLLTACALVVALTACSADDADRVTSTPGQVQVADETSTFLAAHDLEGMDGIQMVDHLDRVPAAERSTDLMASVRPDHLLLADVRGEVSVPLPEDRFYLSLAPYVEHTHDCFYHSLTTCQGELANESVRVRMTDDATGEVLVDEQTETFDNGFIGYWLPAGTSGTIEVTLGDLSGTRAFSTGDEDPTCVTTLHLEGAAA